MLGGKKTVRDFLRAAAASDYLYVIIGIDVDLFDTRHVEPFAQKGDTSHIFIQGAAEFLRTHTFDMVRTVLDIPENEFLQKFLRRFLVTFRRQLICMVQSAVALDIRKDLLIGN